MRIRSLILLLGFLFGLYNSVLSQGKVDSEFPDDEEYEWFYLNLDLSYGSSGPGGALGFRYSFLGVGISATGFANDIPKTVPKYENPTNLQLKTYPSNTVCADFFGYYDLEDVSLFASVGYYASVDSIIEWDAENRLYYKNGAITKAGICFGAGAQMPLTFINEENVYLEQVVAGIGFHTRLGLFLRIAYRW